MEREKTGRMKIALDCQGCKLNQAETEHLAGVPVAARAALEAAEAVASDVKAGADSELGLALARVHSLLGD